MKIGFHAILLALGLQAGLMGQERTSIRIDFLPSPERATRLSMGYPRVMAPKGAYGIEGHGDSRYVYCKQGRAMTAAELAQWVLRDPAYRQGMPVYLMCCETGKGRNPIAQKLADILGCTVVAPTERLWPLKDGRYIVAPPTPDGRKADITRLGSMKHFQPTA